MVLALGPHNPGQRLQRGVMMHGVGGVDGAQSLLQGRAGAPPQAPPVSLWLVLAFPQAG